MNFQPVKEFNKEINRAERTMQAEFLVPLLANTDGRKWFLERIGFLDLLDEVSSATVYHLCFPLRDLFTADYYQVHGKSSDLKMQLVHYYNSLFGLDEGWGIDNIWFTAPNNELRHPAAGGRAGWYDAFLRERIEDEEEYRHARRVRRMLGTEADAIMFTDSHVVLIECKYRTSPSLDQYRRHGDMGSTLARRVGKRFHFGMVVENHRDPKFAQIHVPYVRWDDIREQLGEM